jgi:uncharacterized protein
LAQPRRNDVKVTRPADERRPKDRSHTPMEMSTLEGAMEPGQNCAYNQTRECILGLQVVSGDFSLASLKDWMSTLTPNSSAGIWLTPFRGILATDADIPLDLLYLDADCRVLDVVEFFPTFRVSPASPPAASVLALPSHSIFSSQTQRGDQLILGGADEMKWRLEQLSQTGNMAGGVPHAPSSSVPGPVLVREDSKKAAVSALIREEPNMAAVSAPLEPPLAPAVLAPAPPQPSVAKPWVKPAGKSAKSQRGWLERWLFPNPAGPRRAGREPVAGLVAHFFTGGAPQAHDIRDISATGLYVVTTERWYPGTVIRMTLSKPDTGQPPSERSITIQARSVRWGNDGVGLQFVVEPSRTPTRGQPSTPDAVDSKRLDHFLKRPGKGKR